MLKGYIKIGEVNLEKVREKILEKVRQTFLKMWVEAVRSAQYQKEFSDKEISSGRENKGCEI